MNVTVWAGGRGGGGGGVTVHVEECVYDGLSG